MMQYKVVFPNTDEDDHYWIVNGTQIQDLKAEVLEIGFKNIKLFVLGGNTVDKWEELDEHAKQAVFGGE